MAQIRDGGFLINLLALGFKEKSHDLFGVVSVYSVIFRRSGWGGVGPKCY